MARTSPHIREMHCLQCGYSLNHIPSTRCPECGRPFDPHDPTTTSQLGRWYRVEAWSLKPSGVLRPLTIVAVCFGLVASVLYMGSRALSLLALCHAFILVAAVYLPKRILRWRTVARHGMPREMLDVDRQAVKKGRRDFLVAALLIALRLPFLAVFYASLPLLRRAAVYHYEVAPATSHRPQNTFVGLFPIRRTVVHLGGATFETHLGGALIYSEFPAKSYRPLRQIHGNWYTLEHRLDDLSSVPLWGR